MPPRKSRSPKPAAKRLAKRPAKRREGSTKVDLRIDRALKRSWDRANAVVQRARREGSSAFDELWETAGEIVDHDPPLYLAGGIASRHAFFREHLGESPRSAERWIKVARYASPAEETHYGTSKLDAAIDFIEKKLGAPLPARLPVDFESLRIPVVPTNKSAPKSKRFPEASVEEVRAAARTLATKHPERAAKAPPVVVALRKSLATSALRGITIAFTRGRLSLGAIPIDALPALARALADFDLPNSAH